MNGTFGHAQGQDIRKGPGSVLPHGDQEGRRGAQGLGLIAAAPDLVAALEAMLTLDNRDNGNQMADAITDMARAALARAKGEKC